MEPSKECAQCGSKFTLFKRKYKCKACKKSHCDDCLDSFKIPNPGVSAPRVCKACYPGFDKQADAPPRGPVTPGMTRICIAGYSVSPHYTRAHNVGVLLSLEFADKYEYWNYGESRDDFFVWLVGWKETVIAADSPFQKHKTSPICWLESDDGTVKVLGGRDKFVEWVADNHSGSKADQKGDSFVNPFESLRIPPPPIGPVTAGKIKICVAGYGISPNYTRAHNVAVLLSRDFSDNYEYWSYGPTREEYFDWLGRTWKKTIPDDSPFQDHKTAPICWFEKDDGSKQIIGGRDRLVEWTAKNHPGSKADKAGEKMLNPFEQNL